MNNMSGGRDDREQESEQFGYSICLPKDKCMGVQNLSICLCLLLGTERQDRVKDICRITSQSVVQVTPNTAIQFTTEIIGMGFHSVH